MKYLFKCFPLNNGTFWKRAEVYQLEAFDLIWSSLRPFSQAFSMVFLRHFVFFGCVYMYLLIATVLAGGLFGGWFLQNCIISCI